MNDGSRLGEDDMGLVEEAITSREVAISEFFQILQAQSIERLPNAVLSIDDKSPIRLFQLSSFDLRDGDSDESVVGT